MKSVVAVQGELALAFGELLRKLWSSGRTTIPPRAFKGKLARFAPQFSGYNQHDSQVSSSKCQTFSFLQCSFSCYYLFYNPHRLFFLHA